MSMKKKYIYGDRLFETKKDAKAFFKSILDDYSKKLNEPIKDVYHNSLLDLLLNHTHSSRKCGCGIYYFYVNISPSKYGGPCFYVCRFDGSCTDFSYNECLTNSTSKSSVMKAMRNAVYNDIYIAKKEYFDYNAKDGYVSCPLTGQKINWDMSHADHEQPQTFEMICTSFIFARGYDWDTVPLLSTDNQVKDLQTQFQKDFITYHKRIAKIRVISSYKNCSQATMFAMKQKKNEVGYITINNSRTLYQQDVLQMPT